MAKLTFPHGAVLEFDEYSSPEQTAQESASDNDTNSTFNPLSTDNDSDILAEDYLHQSTDDCDDNDKDHSPNAPATLHN